MALKVVIQDRFKSAPRPEKRVYKALSAEGRRQLLCEMLLQSDKGAVTPKIIADAAVKFGVSHKTAKRLYDGSGAHTGSFKSLDQHRKGRCGRKPLHTDLRARIQAVPFAARTSLRDLAAAVGVPKSTLHDRFVAGYLKKYTRPLKPALTDSNKYVRNQFLLTIVTWKMTWTSYFMH